MSRTILHLDADAFFASVEQSTDARLRGKAVAVGGEKRGIIASASYEARKFGIYTPMPTAMARRLCPKLIILPGDFEKYEFFSRLMFSYAYDFTPDVEIGSIDEGYFDLSGARKPALGIAETIRRAIRQALKISVSEGIGSNKLISQIASKLEKPAAFQLVPPGDEARFLSGLANKWLPGVGPKTASQLNAAGLARIGQIAHTPADLLGLIVGNQAPQMRNFALGIDERPVIPARAPAKSYGEQETFAADTTDEEFLGATLRRMADKLMAKVREDGKSIRTLAVKVRYNDMDEEQASESLDEPTDLETEIYSRLSLLLRKAWKRRVSLRLISLKLSNLYDRRFRSALALDASDRQREAGQRLVDVVDDLRQKYGRAVVLRGHDFILRAKSGRGEEPRSSRRKEAPAQQSEVGSQRAEVDQSLLTSAATSQKCNLAVVQRQRIGHYATRNASDTGTGSRAVLGSQQPRTREDAPMYFRLPVHSDALRAQDGSRSVHSGHPSAWVGGAKYAASRLTPRVSSIPLNVHSYYSFLDSTLSINAIVELAKHYELPAIALTDKNNLHGAVEFAQAAAKAGIKPIIGAEIEYGGHRVCLYVQNQEGYQNLCRILSQENESPEIEQHKVRTPRCLSKVQSPKSGFQDSRVNFFDSTDGLIAISPDPKLAHFFPDRFYLEVNSLEALEKYHSITSSMHHSIPCVASFPIHYEKPSDRWKYDIVQSIRTLTLLRQVHPEKRLDGEYHFRSSIEMQKLFAASRRGGELLAHSVELADRCSFEFSLGKPQFPGYTPPDGSTPAAFLHRLVMEGLQRRYPKDHGQLKSQLEEELAIITDVGYEEYFLVMWDILQECGRRGIEWITRGSAADSRACYCLGISGVCPIRFDLYFRRFLNKDRMALNKLPDIDVDFAHDRKDDVIDLIFEKYGAEQTAIVGGFSTFQSRSAFAEVAKVLGVSEYQVRRITERLPNFTQANELTEAVATTQECRDLPLEEEPYSTALQMAHFLDGFPRYPKMHPCGLVLSRQPMDQVVPCFISAKGYPTTHFDMDSVEAVGLVKMDILAQGGLAVMRDVKEMLRMRSAECGVRSEDSTVQPPSSEALRRSGSPKSTVGVTIDLNALEPWTDPQVWELIANGHARAVHHIESPAMISLCKMCDVRDIDTLIAIVSVIRPGAANESKKMEFARRYQGLVGRASRLPPGRLALGPANAGETPVAAGETPTPLLYPHPSLERCLRSTYGLVVYEEHILQICEAFAGLPPGRADVLRRALGKDKAEVISQIETEFADCARKLGRSESEIVEVWNLVAGFKGYAFCKAHSTAYGVEAYQSAWLKLNHPAEFMAAVLTNGKGFYDPLVYVLECHRLGIPLLPPSVNEPGPGFAVTNAEKPSCKIRNPNAEIRRNSECRNPKQTATREFLVSAFGLRPSDFGLSIRVPVLNVKGLTSRTKEMILCERARGKFASLPDFFLRVQPLNEEMQSMIQAGAFDDFGKTRTAQYWEFRASAECGVRSAESSRDGSVSTPHSALRTPHFDQLLLLPPENLDRLPSVPLAEPDRLQRLRWEEELLGYPASGHPLELYPAIAWDTYCPINCLGDYVGEQIVTCGLVIEQRLFHQITGEPMKFLTIADWTGVVETELFARTYKSYGLTTIRYRVLEITGTVEPFENGRGFTLRVHRADKPRTHGKKDP